MNEYERQDILNEARHMLKNDSFEGVVVDVCDFSTQEFIPGVKITAVNCSPAQLLGAVYACASAGLDMVNEHAPHMAEQFIEDATSLLQEALQVSKGKQHTSTLQ